MNDRIWHVVRFTIVMLAIVLWLGIAIYLARINLLITVLMALFIALVAVLIRAFALVTLHVWQLTRPPDYLDTIDWSDTQQVRAAMDYHFATQEKAKRHE